jgi:DDE superfamily endonuclease
MASGEYPTSTFYGASSSSYTVANRPSSNPLNKIIVHVTQGSWSGGISWFQAPRAQVSAHKMKKVRELIEGRGCHLVFLPSYSPDFNPIEQAFSKVKTLLRKAKARSFEALVEASGRALSTVTKEDARGFFAHCDYGSQRALLL